jgi:hypothetical protein
LVGIVLLGVAASSSIGAVPNSRRTTHFTFSRSVRLPGVTLPAGSYTFEIVNPDNSADLVRVTSRDRSTVYALQFTHVVYRPHTQNMKATIRLGETLAGTPPAVTSWFPEEEAAGRAFIF